MHACSLLGCEVIVSIDFQMMAITTPFTGIALILFLVIALQVCFGCFLRVEAHSLTPSLTDLVNAKRMISGLIRSRSAQ